MRLQYRLPEMPYYSVGNKCRLFTVTGTRRTVGLVNNLGTASKEHIPTADLLHVVKSLGAGKWPGNPKVVRTDNNSGSELPYTGESKNDFHQYQ